MRTDTNYKIRVGLSTDSYRTKAEQNAAISSLQESRRLGLKRKMAFKETELRMNELLDKCITGYTFCHRFGNFTKPPKRTTYVSKKDGSFTLAAKCDAFFIGTNLLCIDIDETGYSDLTTYLNQIEKKPSFWYTSFSNGQPGKGLRFRLVYVIQQTIRGKFLFKYCSEMLNKMIEADTGEEITDKCNLRCSQYFNGTNINTPGINYEYGITGNVYSLSEIAGADFEDYTDWLCGQLENPNLSEADEQRIYEELDIEPTEEWLEESDVKVSRNLFTDSIQMSYDDFQIKHRREYSFIYRREYDGLPWIDGYYKKVDEYYFELYWNVKPVEIGGGRKRALLQRACLRRLMNPWTTADELFWNLYEDVYSRNRSMVDNSDGSITCKTLRRLAEKAMGLELRDIVERYSGNIEYLIATTRPKDGIILNTSIYRGTEAGKYGHKKARRAEYGKNAESGLSVKENLKRLEDGGLKISDKTEYNIRKEKGQVHRRYSDEELLGMIKSGQSVRSIVADLKKKGVHVSRERIGKLIERFNQTAPTIEDIPETESYMPEIDSNEGSYFENVIGNVCSNYDFGSIPSKDREEKSTPTTMPEFNMPKISVQGPDFLRMWPLIV